MKKNRKNYIFVASCVAATLLHTTMGKRSKQARHLAALRASKKARKEHEQEETDRDTNDGSVLTIDDDIETMSEPDYGLFQSVSEVVLSIKESLPQALLSRALGYSGNSRTTLWRRKKELEETLKACPMRSIQSYFTSKNLQPEEKVQSRTCIVLSEKDRWSNHLSECFQKIDCILSNSNSNFSRRELVQYMAILKTLSFLMQGVGKVASAEKASECISGRSSRTGRCILNWTNIYLETMELPVSFQGKHQKTVSLLRDEDVVARVLQWLRESSKVNRCPEKLCVWINDVLLPELVGSEVQSISVRRVRDLMNSLGYKYGVWKKGVYIDGHERDDVVQYRDAFLSRMIPLMDRMVWWDGDEMEHSLERLNIEDSQIVWVSHDESVYYSNDDGGKGWGSEEHPDIHKKGKGRCIMVSDFICPCHGRLRLDDKPIAEIIEPGKNHDGYWQAPDILRELELKALPAFEQMHPGASGLFVFDNSTNHGAYSNDALIATPGKMNLSSGGKVPAMRDTWFINAAGERVSQRMVDDEGIPKGLKKILSERNLWIEKLKMYCKGLPSPTEADPTCCAIHRMAAQPDFQAQKSILYEALENTRHVCEFLPKFHCELAPIENFWGFSKAYTRQHCDYSINTLRKTVPESLDAVPLSSIRKYFRRACHLMQAYNQGYSYKLAIYAHNKYKSHRRIPEGKMEEIMAEIRQIKIF